MFCPQTKNSRIRKCLEPSRGDSKSWGLSAFLLIGNQAIQRVQATFSNSFELVTRFGVGDVFRLGTFMHQWTTRSDSTNGNWRGWWFMLRLFRCKNSLFVGEKVSCVVYTTHLHWVCSIIPKFSVQKWEVITTQISPVPYFRTCLPSWMEEQPGRFCWSKVKAVEGGQMWSHRDRTATELGFYM